MLAAQTGLRVSEIIDLDRDSVMLGQGAHVQCVGKGRKQRSTPLTKVAQQALRRWLKEPGKRGATALFPNMHGGSLSADGVQALRTNMSPKRASTASPFARSGCRPMSCGTALPWRCYRRASIARSLPCGWAMRRWKRR
ncbi:tyrosine-type recombinase/integrase [Ensifer aridi]|uniref:tyrosine-type recombinase/integrase n=1 Tax=Ensifer aridi TaxID=1708715 RepID=UPI001FDA9ECF|nr:tyrosine-type recombinase/integrase [Ensifer aridi]